MAAETQRDNREPNSDCSDGSGGNADPFPHCIRLAPSAATSAYTSVYYGIGPVHFSCAS